MKKFPKEIISLLQNGVGRFDKEDDKKLFFVEVEEYEKETWIKVQAQKYTPEEFLNLLKEHKDKNPWLYNEIFVEKVEFLI